MTRLARVIRLAGVITVFGLAVLVVSLVGVTADADTDTCVGPVEQSADAETVVTAQGLQIIGDSYEKRPAILASYDGEARPIWSHDLSERGRFISRTVESTPDGTLLVTQEGSHTVVELLDDDRRQVWALRFGLGDGTRGDIEARDALVETEGLLVADRKRLVRYDRETDRVRQEWPLPEDAFPDEQSRITGVAPTDDGYLVTVAGNGTGSLLAVSEGGVEWRVDELEEPHGPQSVGETVLLTEMGADRVVELDANGEVIWSLSGLDRPRSAERLPDGNTLVADRRNHRVIEVTPEGRVVWTAFVPWEPADATRAVDGEPPSVSNHNATGDYEVSGPNATYDELEVCEAGLVAMGENRTERAVSIAEDGGDGLVGAAVLGVLTLLGGVYLYRKT